MSLLQLSLWTEALKGKGFSPELDFHVDNFLGIFVGGKGNYYFLDRNELAPKTKGILHQITGKPDFAPRLRAKAEKLYRELEQASIGLGKAAHEDNPVILKHFRKLRKAFGEASLLTMPAYGVEACASPESPLVQFLSAKLGKKPRKEELLEEINALSVSMDATAAFEERKSFLEVAVASRKKLDERLLDRHIARFQWVNTEYVSPEWPRERYEKELGALLIQNPEKLLEEHLANYAAQLHKKDALLKELHPPAEVLAVVEALGEFMREFDWGKACYCKAFLNWRPFVRELAKRMECDETQVLFHTPDEIEDFLTTGRKVKESEIARRQSGFVLLMRDEKIGMLDGGTEEIARLEGVHQTVFGDTEDLEELRGTVASAGRATGKVKVVQSVSDLKRLEKGDILVTYMTTMELTPAFHKAAAIVTDEGGIFSHAAIVSREFGLPCIVGTKKATRVFKDGDLVEVDADAGIARKIKA